MSFCSLTCDVVIRFTSGIPPTVVFSTVTTSTGFYRAAASSSCRESRLGGIDSDGWPTHLFPQSAPENAMNNRLLIAFLSLSVSLSSPVYAAADDHWDDQFAGPGAEGTLLGVTVDGTD